MRVFVMYFFDGAVLIIAGGPNFCSYRKARKYSAMLTYSSTAGSLKWEEEWQICLHKSVNHKLLFQSADKCPAREKNKDHHLQAMLCPFYSYKPLYRKQTCAPFDISTSIGRRPVFFIYVKKPC